MSRPKTHGPRSQLQIRLDPATIDRLQAEAKARMVSTNWLAARLIGEGLDRLIPVGELSLARDPAKRIRTTGEVARGEVGR